MIVVFLPQTKKICFFNQKYSQIYYELYTISFIYQELYLKHKQHFSFGIFLFFSKSLGCRITPLSIKIT